MRASAADHANDAMVDRMIGQGMLWSPPLIGAFRATPRHRFLDRVFIYQRKQGRWRAVATQPPEGDEVLRLVYSDRALITKVHRPEAGCPEVPVSSSSQPSLMAQMLEDLRVGPGQRVLEIGAGTGYNAALLAHVAGSVFSVDVDQQVVAEAMEHLHAFPERHVEFRHGDGRNGLPEEGPFDRIMVAAATPDLEPAWLRQTAEGGLVVAPLVLAPGLAYIARGTVRAGAFEGRLTRTAWFLPLRGEEELGRTDELLAPAVPSTAPLPAPWAEWIDSRRARLGSQYFLQAFAFYAWLRGCQIAYGTMREGEAAYALLTDAGEAVCWVSGKTWAVKGTGGREFGERMWRAFLDDGAPWPTEFRLRAGLGPLPEPSGRTSAVRRAAFCWQTWELIEPRDRPGGIEA
jgi:protein-L-isoaspartate(D-aspartate) O-methyltransferase